MISNSQTPHFRNYVLEKFIMCIFFLLISDCILVLLTLGRIVWCSVNPPIAAVEEGSF